MSRPALFHSHRIYLDMMNLTKKVMAKKNSVYMPVGIEALEATNSS